jgi:LemA protein
MISLLVIPALILIMAVVFYNRFVRMRNEVRNALGNVDVYLKKRYDLLPNLISVV